MLIRELLSEGGWVSVETQSTKLTPTLVKKTTKLFPKLQYDLNLFLHAKGMAPISFGAVLGSTAHLDRDLEHDPLKEYGDIDVMMVLPETEGTSEAKMRAEYNKAIDEFLKTKKPEYVAVHNKEKSNAIIFNVDGQAVQVDIVTTLSRLQDWSRARMTPEYGVKGAVLGFLYSSLAQVLNLSIGTSGVQFKEKGGEVVAFKNLKVDKVHTVSTNLETFGADILKAFYLKDHGGVPKMHPSLVTKPGMNTSHITGTDIVDVIHALAKSFELNDMYRKGSLKHLSSSQDFLNEVAKVYRAKIDDAMNASKFNKAVSDAAKEKVKKTVDHLKTQSEKLLTRF